MLVINIFNHDTDCLTDLISFGFNVTHFERIHLGESVLLVNIDALNGLAISSTSNSKIEAALAAYYADNPLEIIYRLPKQKAVKRVERWGIELDARDIHTPYDCNINAQVCRNAVRNAQVLAQCKAVVEARRTADSIAKECLEIAIQGCNKRYFAVDFRKIDKQELFARLNRLDYKVTEDANVSSALIVTW